MDLRSLKTITGIITQGGKWNAESYYVKTFKVAYSDNNSGPWIIKESNGSEKVSYMFSILMHG